MARARAELAKYDPGHTAVDKYDKRYANADTNNSIFLHPYDPGANASLMVGRYNVRETPEGPVAYDTYDFDNTPGNSLMSEGVVAKLNALANLVRPGASRPVRIKLK